MEERLGLIKARLRGAEVSRVSYISNCSVGSVVKIRIFVLFSRVKLSRFWMLTSNAEV